VAHAFLAQPRLALVVHYKRKNHSLEFTVKASQQPQTSKSDPVQFYLVKTEILLPVFNSYYCSDLAP